MIYFSSINYQYDEHLAQLESNIQLVQQRAMEQADIDTSWMGPEDENYTIAETSEFQGVSEKLFGKNFS